MQTNKPARWFRMYAEFLHDPKVQMLSELDQRRYIMLLCARCSNGDVTLQDSEVAFQLRISDDDWCASKRVLLSKSLITDDNKPTNWDKRQFASDSSAERVSKHRALRKQACNVTETKCNALEKEKEKEKETESKEESVPSRFDEFWSEYPVKKSKPQAVKAFARAKINGEFDQVMESLRVQVKACKDLQYFPHASTWLNNRRWEDELVRAGSGSADDICGIPSKMFCN